MSRSEEKLWLILDVCEVYGKPRQELEDKIKPIFTELVKSTYVAGYRRAKKGQKLPSEYKYETKINQWG